MKAKNKRKPLSVAVLGAAGHTGRFVVAELLRRGIQLIAVARDQAAFKTTNFAARGVSCRGACLGNPDSLDRALDGAGAVIHCAGPFLETADAAVRAALRASIHYLDLSAEQPSTRAVLDAYDDAAKAARIAVIPAMGFYGGFADLLVTAALDGSADADSVEVLIGLDSWHPTRGTRVTGARNTAPREVVADGRLAPMATPRKEMDWEFGDPLGCERVAEVPFSEIILIERHVRTRELHTYLSSKALDEIRDPATPAPKAADAAGRSRQRFVVDVVVSRDGMARRITARGRDIYAFSAPLICEAAARLLEGRFHTVGAQPPGMVFDASGFLSALTPGFLSLELRAARPQSAAIA